MDREFVRVGSQVVRRNAILLAWKWGRGDMHGISVELIGREREIDVYFDSSAARDAAHEKLINELTEEDNG